MDSVMGRQTVAWAHKPRVAVRAVTPKSEENTEVVAIPTFDEVYRDHRARLVSIVRSVVGHDTDLDDVMQGVFIEIHRSLPRFEARSKLTTWLYRLAVNVALQHIRKRRRARWLAFVGFGEDIPEPRNGPSEVGRLEGRELLRHVDSAIAALPEKKRVVWQLYELEGFEPAEIGEMLGIPMNTARSRLLAARREILEHLERRGLLDVAGAAGARGKGDDDAS
jgi:RNA polymerase sigma-70 factor (ECF subfamily)